MTERLIRSQAAGTYASAVMEIRKIMEVLGRCIAVEDEAEALSDQLDRLEAAGTVLLREEEPSPTREDLARCMAREAVASMPLSDICQDREMLGAFAAEVVQALLTASEACRTADRRRRQADGIAAARANGVQFGRQKTPLPLNFDKVRTQWRSGGCTLRDAADLCGMTKSSFYRAVRRAEESGASSERVPVRQERPSDTRIGAV